MEKVFESEYQFLCVLWDSESATHLRRPGGGERRPWFRPGTPLSLCLGPMGRFARRRYIVI